MINPKLAAHLRYMGSEQRNAALEDDDDSGSGLMMAAVAGSLALGVLVHNSVAANTTTTQQPEQHSREALKQVHAEEIYTHKGAFNPSTPTNSVQAPKMSPKRATN